MKKLCLTAALSMACAAPLAQADVILGLYAGADAWQAKSTGSMSHLNIQSH